jgi:Sulfotransferase family
LAQSKRRRRGSRGNCSKIHKSISLIQNAKPQAAERIAAALPTVPLVAQLRNPVDRAYSDYCMLYRRGTVTGPAEDYLDPRTSEFRRFLDNGLYFQHLSRWFDLFARDQIRIFLFEDVQNQPEQLISDISAHVGVTAHPVAKIEARVNDSTAQFLPLPIRKLLTPVKRLVQPWRGSTLFEAARGTMAKSIVYPPLKEDLRQRMQDYYADEIESLSALLGRDLSHWQMKARIAA